MTTPAEHRQLPAWWNYGIERATFKQPQKRRYPFSLSILLSLRRNNMAAENAAPQGLTLWLVPSPSDSERLKKIMTPRTKSDLISDASYPQFEPHITLASIPDSSLDAIVSSIPTTQPALPIAFDAIEVGDHYFRSVYIAVHLSEALVELHRHVHEKLGITSPRTPKFPHVSLCYIADEDATAGERDRYFQQLQGSIRRNGTTVSLNCGEPGEADWVSSFEAREIWVTRCKGPVETWIVVKKIPLH
ncbi:Cyclic phosphodiesterase [Mycena sanguinolenta]|uniref:Cyclic phosphodiesterase n=1 Tax=Mycena sanguinolenta TaxID=230812 RepID=A0A8H7D653_9AGAR|nr:Cyclic phosphodiesterase [Mycena sanguinolenta]